MAQKRHEEEVVLQELRAPPFLLWIAVDHLRLPIKEVASLSGREGQDHFLRKAKGVDADNTQQEP